MVGPGTKLGAFEIVGLLGKGGMGAVYRARDTRLNRDVAIKVLLEEIASDPAYLALFDREAKVLASLDHPNVGSIHDFQHVDGVHFLVMQLVEGETLSDRIRKGALPLREALSLFTQIARGLDAAHEAGIVHRDLKPANVKIAPNGEVKVLDFGIAKAQVANLKVEHDAPTTPMSFSPTTGAGFLVGTPQYMSPEQARGRPVDRRTDVWAFGCCMYEALTGVLPFTGETFADIVAGIVHTDPDWSKLPELPREIKTLFRRSLEKDVNRRLSSMHDIAILLEETEDSQRHPAAEPGRGARQSRKIERIAVLPFVNQSGDPSQESFADGMRDALNTELAKVSSIKLIGRMAAQRYKNTDLSPSQIADGLNGVDAFVCAAVLRDTEDNVRITVELMDPYTQETLWTEPYERHLQNIFQLHSEVALKIVHEIQAVITPEETERIQAKRPDVVPEAYDAYLRGLELWNPDEDSTQAALAEYQRTVLLDPNFADAWYCIGRTYWYAISWGFVLAKDLLSKTKEALQKALDLNENHSCALTYLAQIQWRIERDYLGAEEGFHKAIAQDPNNAEAYERYAYLLAVMGRRSEAIEKAQLAIELEPDNPEVFRDAGNTVALAGDSEGALALLARAHELRPQDLALGSFLCRVYLENGMYEQAVTLGAEVDRLGGGHPVYRMNYGITLALADRAVEAAEAINSATSSLPDDATMAVWRAVAAAVLDDRDAQWKWYERAYESRDPTLPEVLRVYSYILPELLIGSARRDPRYWALIEKLKLPPLPPEHPGYAEEQEWLLLKKAEELIKRRGLVPREGN